MNNTVSFIPLGGVGDVTRNMYLYEYRDEILIVDCGLGFADETMLGVDLLLPDISYLLKTKKKIVGMALTHGHEDHVGALPFILPQLAQNGRVDFPIFGGPLTSVLANEKLNEYKISAKVKSVNYDNDYINLGNFSLSFIRVTHSIPDSAHIFIKSPVGNFYHASDFKFDLTPFDGKKTDFAKIVKLSDEGVLCLMSDCLRAEKEGHTPSEQVLYENIEKEMKQCSGKFILTTYSSNISRLNQAILAAKKLGRKVCFLGRSLVKTSDAAQELGYMNLGKDLEISPDHIKKYKDQDLLLLVAGSQAQENSALSRIVNGEHPIISINSKDVVVFSADPIPGNEVSINSLIDSISKKGARVVYSQISDDFHVSGHAASDDLMLMMELVRPKKVLPIGGTYRQMVAYKNLAQKQKFEDKDILLIEDGQEVKFSKESLVFGNKLAIKSVYVDEISGEEVEQFVLRDRQKISKEGVVVVIVEVDSATSIIVNTPTIISRGFTKPEGQIANTKISMDIKNSLTQNKGRVTDWMYIRKFIGEKAEKSILNNIHRRPLVLPVVIEV
ncbi:MAG: ribonuclease J [Candidatus Levybacteria bacterium]|nr:ribonuclease J [Candidatus Levybacteria bacterium]